ncbi:MAG: AraC family transcriptional regulator [Bacteroidales bacterium]|nr:AraC family transcriptional regulator [Bacteroidales bacterium]
MNGIHTLRDHSNILDKRWYGNVLLIGNDLQYMDTIPRLASTQNWAVVKWTQGTLSFRYNFNTHKVTAPALLIFRPDGVFEYLKHSHDIEGSIVLFSELFLENLQPYFNFTFLSAVTRKPYTTLSDDDVETFNLYQQLLFKLAEKPQTPTNDSIISNALSSFINHFIHCYEQNECPEAPQHFKTRGEQICHQFIQLVSANALHEREINYYADQLHLSPKYLAQTIKRITQKTPGEWIHRMIIRHAKTLLYDEALSMQQISDQLNFATPSHFSAFFKRETGLTPSTYRKSIQNIQVKETKKAPAE